MLEHPDITAALLTGHPAGWKEPEPIRCPICGAEEPDALYRFRGNRIEWFGCSECIWDTLREVDLAKLDEDELESLY